MIVLGIDPGSAVTGVGVIARRDRARVLVACEPLRPNPRHPFEKRLLEIHDDLLEVIEDVKPDEVALEAAFFGRNVRTAMKMCHARGAIMLALAKSHLPIFEYSPREVKKGVVGRGGATKEQVGFMVRHILNVRELPGPHDVTDALALALCHLNRRSGLDRSRKPKRQVLRDLSRFDEAKCRHRAIPSRGTGV